jgi:carboxymethylenebutenolidase
VLGVYAEQDQRINQGIQPLRDALRQAEKTFDIRVYAGVGHGFHNDTGGAWNEAQALAAWRDALAWFDQSLKA